MTTKTALKWIAILGVWLLAAQVSAEEVSPLKTQKDMENYGMGVYVVRNFKQQGIEIDLDLVMKGMRDEFSGQKLLIPENELTSIMTTFQNQLRMKQAATMRTAGEENKRKGNVFLAENKEKEGVVTLPSGLQYKILKKGEGNNPATLAVAAVINGWKEALILMPVGSKWQLFVPPQLAYGFRGSGRNIPPNATLIFELELLAIK